MPNPAKATPGQKAIDTRTWNEMVDMLEWWRRRYGFGNTGGPEGDLILGDRIKVKNNSGSNLRRGDVVSLDRVALLTTLSRRDPWIRADKLSDAASTRNQLLACLIDPITNGNIGPAQLRGVCLVYVDVKATWHRRAYPVASDDVLDSGVFGPVELLTTPASTGEQLCLATIGHAANRGMFVKTTSSITAAVLTSGRLTLGSGTATVQDPYSTATQYEDAPTHSLTIYNQAGDAIDSGAFLTVTPTDDWLPLATIEACTAPEEPT
jgi:hypothetical protein